MRAVETPMAFDRSVDEQAVALFLAEAGELFQQFEEGLLLLAHEPSPLTLQKIARSAQLIHQGAGQVGLVDLQLLAQGLSLLLERDGEDSPQGQMTITSDLLHQFCDNLQCSLIVHRSMTTNAEGTNRREFVLNALIPKALDILKLMLAQPLQPQTRQQLLQQQMTQWIQWWSNILDLTELKTIADVALRSIAAFPDAAAAIATVALAGFQVAYEATIQRLSPSVSVVPLEPMPEAEDAEPPSFYPPERSPTTTLNLSQHLAGLAHQAIFCVATQSILEIVLPQPGQRQSKDGQDYLLWQDRLLELHHFADLWRPSTAVAQLSGSTATPDELVLVLRHEPAPLALALEVDRLIVESELVLGQPEALSDTPHRCRYGWTCMNDESWIEVVNVNCLIQAHPIPATPVSRLMRSVLPRIEGAEQSVTFLEDSISLKNPPLQKPKTILVVDDSKTVREILSLTLQEAGYCVVQAKDGQAAIAQLEQQAQIHLTICDLEMSNLNGFEFLRHRLQDQRWTQIPVLILSSHTSNEYRQLAQKLGAADYLSIPYDPSQLLETIQNLLNK